MAASSSGPARRRSGRQPPGLLSFTTGATHLSRILPSFGRLLPERSWTADAAGTTPQLKPCQCSLSM